MVMKMKAYCNVMSSRGPGLRHSLNHSSCSPFFTLCGRGGICCSIAREMEGSEQGTSELSLGTFSQPDSSEVT